MTFLLVYFLVGVATLDPAEPEEPAWPVEWGLGLDVNAPPPDIPSPESPQQLARLFAFGNASIEPLLDRCATETTVEYIHHWARRHRIQAFLQLERACEEFTFPDAGVPPGVPEGIAIEAFKTSASKVEAGLDALSVALKAIEPGTEVDAEFLAYLQVRQVQLRISLSDTLSSMQSLTETQRAAVNWQRAAQIPAHLADRTTVLNYYLANYDWQEGECSVPELGPTAVTANRLLRRADEASQEAMAVDHVAAVMDYQKKQLDDWGMQIEAMLEEEFALAIVYRLPHLQFQAALWENLTAVKAPSAHEALWLLDAKESELDTLATGSLFDDVRNIVRIRAEDRVFRSPFSSNSVTLGPSWTKYDGSPGVAFEAVALQAVTWPFADFDCRPVDTSQA